MACSINLTGASVVSVGQSISLTAYVVTDKSSQSFTLNATSSSASATVSPASTSVRQDELIFIPLTVSGVEAGTSRIRVTLVDYDLIQKATQYIDVTVTLPQASWDTLPTAKDGLVYIDEQQVLINAGTSSSGTPKYKFSTDSAWTSSVNDIKKQSVGQYTVQYYVAGDGSHSDSSVGSLTVSIGKATKAITADPDLTGATFAWDGQEHMPANFVPNGTIAGLVASGTITPQINTGSYTITYNVTEDENYIYTFTNGSRVARQLNWSITNPAVTLSPLTFSNVSAGASTRLTVNLIPSSGTVISGVISASVNGSGASGVSVYNVSTSAVQLTLLKSASGTYTFDLTVSGITITQNGQSTSINCTETVTISVVPSITQYPVLATTPVTYNGNERILVSTYGVVTGGEFQYKVGSGSWSSNTGLLKRTDAGSYSVRYRVLDSGGGVYVDSTLLGTFVINEKAQSWTYDFAGEGQKSKYSGIVSTTYTLRISSSTEFSSISVTADKEDVTITKVSDTEFTIVTGSTQETIDFTISTIGATNYLNKSENFELTVTSDDWQPVTLRVFENGQWVTVKAYRCTGGSNWEELQAYEHK